MIWQVTYNDAAGEPLLIATFNADSLQEMLGHMATVPSLQPPAGTVDVNIRIIPP